MKSRSLSLSLKIEMINAIQNVEKKKRGRPAFRIGVVDSATILKRKKIIGTLSDDMKYEQRRRYGEFQNLENHFKGKALLYAKSVGIKDFRVSEGCISNFKSLHGFSLRKLWGESASDDQEVCDEWPNDLKDILKNCSP